MTSAAASYLSGLGLVEVNHAVVSFVYQLVCKPSIVIAAFAEFCPYKEVAVFGAAVNVHVALVSLIDPLYALCLCTAVRAGDINYTGIGKGCGLAFKAVKAFMQQGFRAVVIHGGL